MLEWIKKYLLAIPSEMTPLEFFISISLVLAPLLLLFWLFAGFKKRKSNSEFNDKKGSNSISEEQLGVLRPSPRNEP